MEWGGTSGGSREKVLCARTCHSLLSDALLPVKRQLGWPSVLSRNRLAASVLTWHDLLSPHTALELGRSLALFFLVGLFFSLLDSDPSCSFVLTLCLALSLIAETSPLSATHGVPDARLCSRPCPSPLLSLSPSS
uniref:Uncharacterized protein n=1 Tax=Myotis myotis TaxID=51298 RepID=A0A7J8AN73_MYOMY|nr:hypothetical protein mMyoMyo1_008170 [Myotis myotis]